MSAKQKRSFRLEEWLEKDLEDYIKKHPKLDRTKALHQYIIDLKQQNEESAKEIKRSKEEARHHRKKAEKLSAKALQKTGSTSKPQQEQRWQPISDWKERLSEGISSDGSKFCLFPHYLKKDRVWMATDCKKTCKKDPNSPYEQCAKLWRESAQALL
jgi:hypothetical protein